MSQNQAKVQASATAAVISPNCGEKISNDQLRNINQKFRDIDANSDIRISLQELKEYLEDEDDAKYIMHQFDTNKDGFISFAEFKTALTNVKRDNIEDLFEVILEELQKRKQLINEAEDEKRSRTVNIQGQSILVTHDAAVSSATMNLALKSVPFTSWIDSLNRIKNLDKSKPELLIEKVHVQGVDMFGSRVGFIKFTVAAKKWNEKDKKVALVPGIIFMRGGAVGILCILKEHTKDGNGKEFALVTQQPRLPAGYSDFCEIPAGMLDNERNKFAGKAAEELKEEVMLEIKETDLFDLTHMAYGDRFKGMFPSAGGCDEFIKLFLYRRYVSSEVLAALKDTHGGCEDHEIIRIKLVPLENLYQEAPDAKALSALYLYEIFKKKNVDKKPLPVDAENEKRLLEVLNKQKKAAKKV